MSRSIRRKIDVRFGWLANAGIRIAASAALMTVLVVSSKGMANEHGHAHEAAHVGDQDHAHETAHSNSHEHDAQKATANTHAHASSKGHADKHTEVKASYVRLIWNAFHEKLRQAAELDADNDHLRRRVAELELERARLSEEGQVFHEASRARKLKKEAVEEGGSEAARTVASLKLADPKLLSKPPRAIFEAALEAFDDEDYETAGRALVFLVENPENGAFQDAQGFYLTGVSLYKVGNFKRAIAYLEKSVAHARDGGDISYAPRALGWIALAHKRLGDDNAGKRTIRELIQKFPKSKEARRLNRNA